MLSSRVNAALQKRSVLPRIRSRPNPRSGAARHPDPATASGPHSGPPRTPLALPRLRRAQTKVCISSARSPSSFEPHRLALSALPHDRTSAFLNASFMCSPAALGFRSTKVLAYACRQGHASIFDLFGADTKFEDCDDVFVLNNLPGRHVAVSTRHFAMLCRWCIP